MENHILVERHYLTPQMYREIYMSSQVNPRQQPQINSIRQQQQHIVATNNPIINTTTNANITNNTNTNNNRNNINPPEQIRNLINNLVNTDIPFQLEVSTVPLNRFINRLEATLAVDNTANGITLANVNTLSNVAIYSHSNSTIDMCSICQGNFESNDIIRKLNGCGHLFHLNCIDRWLAEHNTCPTCRNNITTQRNNNIGDNDTSDDNDDSDDNSTGSGDSDGECDTEQCDSDCECDCHECEHNQDVEEDIESEEDAENVDANENNDTENNGERTGFATYFVITNSRQGNTSNASNITILTSNSTPLVNQSTTITNSSDAVDASNITSNVSTSNVRTSNIGTGGAARSNVMNEFQVDLTNLINLGAPFLNTVMGTANTAAEINPSQVNNQVQNIFQNLNPLLTAFSGLVSSQRERDRERNN